MMTKHHAYKGLFVGMILCTCTVLYCTDKDSFKLLFCVIYVIAPVKSDRRCFILEV